MTETPHAKRWTAALTGATIFLSAFLLFQVQPLLGRYILPWFGGMPEVWTTCMLFFQMFLLAGYAYAHALTRLTLRWQVLIHAALALVAAATLSIVPDAAMKPAPADTPVLKILWICMVCVGPAYFVLAATSPLVQSWFSRALPGRNPYRLYALSNVGSLLALASFPFVFEPLLTRQATAQVWSVGFYGYAGLIAACAVVFRATIKQTPPQDEKTSGDYAHTPDLLPLAAAVHNGKGKRKSKTKHRNTKDNSPVEISPERRDRLFWLLLPMAASVVLLAVTNRVTLDIAVIPFLWVLPLSLYLLSFILCFDHPRWYRRGLFMALLVAGMVGHVYIGRKAMDMQAATIIAIYAVMLFACCMICHGELYRLRPHSRYLTGYYLTLSVGGALGGVFVAVAAPLMFKQYHELQLGLLATLLLLLLSLKNISADFARRRRWWAAAICAAGLAGIFLQGQRPASGQRVIDSTRNFFGILSIVEEHPDEPQQHLLLMQHGTTYHGLQFQSDDKRQIPTSYYSPDSGIGLLLEHWPDETPRRIGIIGLGVGTIAAYGRPDDLIRFYEINPEVNRLAQQHFSFLKDSRADIEIVLGDARLSMEYEVPQSYDVLAVDAFSSDAIPVHLLTVEAFEIYLSHLKPDGVLALHISTHHLDLQSVVWKLAEHLGLSSRWIESFQHDETGAMSSDWILLSRAAQTLNLPVLRSRQSIPYADLDRVPLWTDDHINLLEALKKKTKVTF